MKVEAIGGPADGHSFTLKDPPVQTLEFPHHHPGAMFPRALYEFDPKTQTYRYVRGKASS